MIHSQVDSEIWDEELELLTDQEHLEKVWAMMKNNVEEYVDGYLEKILQHMNGQVSSKSYLSLIKELIKKNQKFYDKYHEAFDMESMEEEYAEDVESFKTVVLKNECDVIRGALQSKSEALKEWKAKFFRAKSQELYDTFYNIMDFAKDYEKKMHEEKMDSLNSIEDCSLSDMDEYACYKSGVLGHGIVSNILNHMYPRVFPGNYKAGIYSLMFLSGAKMQGIDMPSGSSEFCMVKDDSHSKSGTIETEHNYYFPYETFAIYTTRIYRVIAEKIKNRFNVVYPTDYRYLITNDFYDYVTEQHKNEIITMTGNDDILKFNTLW